MTREVKVGNIWMGGGRELVLIAGPCVIESEEICLETAAEIKKITERINMPFIFKSSYDKANRSSLESFRGPGIRKGLKTLKRVKDRIGVPITSDIHCREELEEAARVLDIIQIPAFLSRQTDLLLAAGRTGKTVNVKKGQFLAHDDMHNVVNKLISTGNQNILLTERGTSFGYHNLIVDMRNLPQMRKLGYPVVFDATHSVQLPGGRGRESGGQREYVPALARAAVAAGCHGLFLEVHPEPDEALCDGPNMISLKELPQLLKQVKEIDKVVRSKASA
ncbi:3-deoxy-8-phosphooctulonate synthase [candidate division NPL-UPA2 bacterium]|nr:3-deoxy-8-phosphooctulonate synthase [candidate division NPL-UPA2 bacterium]